MVRETWGCSPLTLPWTRSRWTHPILGGELGATSPHLRSPGRVGVFESSDDDEETTNVELAERLAKLQLTNKNLVSKLTETRVECDELKNSIREKHARMSAKLKQIFQLLGFKDEYYA